MSIAKRGLLSLSLSLGLIVVAPVTYAQSAGGYQQNQGGGDISQQKLQKYSQAQQKIMDISQDYRGRLEGIKDQDKAIKLQQQAQQEMAEAVTSAGLTVQEYNRITEEAQNDPELRERLQ